MSTVIDRRDTTSDKSIGSRQRFLNRNRPHIKKAVERAIAGRSIEDIGQGGVDVNVPHDGISEPRIRHGKGGFTEGVFPGNKNFEAGDRIPRPQGGGGGGGGGDASDSGDGEDAFVFQLTEDEFLSYLFDGLELPNLVKQGELDSSNTKPKYAGRISHGPFSKLDLMASRKKRNERVVPMEKPFNELIAKLLEQELEVLKEELSQSSSDESPALAATQGEQDEWESSKRRMHKLDVQVQFLKAAAGQYLSADGAVKIADIEHQIDEVKQDRKRIPRWNENTDLKFRFHTPEPVPTSKAVMFCLMDVSGSMDQETKNNAKLFYFLLNRFLKRHYEEVDVVFIRHHHEAEVVNEHDFFYKPETGGTKVSTVLEKMLQEVEKNYGDGTWNVYAAQASDGDNFSNDSARTAELLGDILENVVQAYFYSEIKNDFSGSGRAAATELWKTYEPLSQKHSDRFWMGRIEGRKDIWPVFREFFKKRETYDKAPIAAFAPGLDQG